MSSSDTIPVRRRQVFYIPGYDPIHPRRYRELYRKQSAEQADISGYEISQSAKSGAGRFGWHVEAVIDGQKTLTDFEVLVWSDIVRDSMGKGVFGTYILLLRTAWVYLSSGALFRLMRLRKGPVITALYPVLFLLVQLIFALLLAWGLWRLLALIHPWLGPAGLILIPLVLEWFRKHDNRFFAYYLMHDYAYSARYKGAYPPALKARMKEFVDGISQALQGDADEVLVVGHSSGAHLAVTVLADLIRERKARKTGLALGFLSLGQVVPMVSFLKNAQVLRRDLAYLSTRDELTWVDVSAPGDGACFALCDPVAVTGVAPHGKRWPLVLSAAFSQTLSPERWKAMRWRFFKLHFQYMCAFDRPADYDYFQITAGPLTLAARYHTRTPSKSRIEMPISGFKDMAL
ncbi:probable integral membrane protein Cj1412c [hydrothermal vent metagenome]|uniref:Probable integral membrane protein Cj1412c n=1 Tax=hydrothermal vent metagenome TaxID=652676 RepID=A0A3B0SDL7_9ZZZZ